MSNGTGPVEGSGSTQGTNQSDTDNWGDYQGDSFGSGDTSSTSSTSSSRSTGSTGSTTRSSYGSSTTPSGTTTTATGTRGLVTSYGTGTISGGGDLPAPPSDEVNQTIQQLAQQGYTNEQIQTAIQQQYGVTVSAEDIQYASQGLQGSGYPPSRYMASYGNPTLNRNYGSPYFQQYLDQIGMVNEAREGQRTARRSGHQQMIKIHMILLQIMMGDIAGAIRSYTVLMERDNRQFTRGIVDKLEKVRDARSRVIRNFANNTPPRAYAGDNPQSAARAQDQAQRFTQFVQLSTQLMGELQNTERELVDALQTSRRDVDNMWQTYAQIRDMEARTTERLLRSG